MIFANRVLALAKAIENEKRLGHQPEWVCEQHPDKPWPHDDCPGPGMLKRDVRDGDLP